MRDIHRGDTQSTLNLHQFEPRLDAKLRVKVAQRLIEQKYRWLADDRTTNRDALLLPAREVLRFARRQGAEAERVGNFLRACEGIRSRRFRGTQGEGDVLQYREVRVQGVILEHHRDVAIFRLQSIHDASVDRDLSTADLFQAGEHAQGGRLAAAGGAHQNGERAVGEDDVDIVDDDGRAVLLAHLVEPHLCHDDEPLVRTRT